VSERAAWIDVSPGSSVEAFADFCHVSPTALEGSPDAAVVLPNNRALPEVPADAHLFAPQAKEVVDALKQGGIQATLYRDERDRRDLVLKSADVLLPVLTFAAESAAGVALGILANWLYDRFIKRDKRPGTVRFEYAILGEDRVIAWRRIEGSVREVRDLMAAESDRLLRQAPAAQPRQLAVGATQRPAVSRHAHEAREKLDTANRLLKDAGKAYRTKSAEGRRTAEGLMRQALAQIRQALLLDPNDKTRRYLHRVGLRIHSLFQCRVEFSDGSYWVTCPVLLSHGRGGFSIGGSGKSICSICGEPALECDHVKGQFYDGVRAWRHDGVCNVCFKKGCNHIEGAAYNGVEAIAIVTELHLDHVAFVTNPSHPLAVVERYSLPRSDILAELPESEHERFGYGETTLYCHHCVTCNGIR
jgi:hypothetical protein